MSGLGQQEVPELEIRCRLAPRHFHDFVVSVGPEFVFLCRTGDTPAHRRLSAQVEALLLARRRGWQWRDRLLVFAGILGPLSAVVLMLAKSYLSPWLPYVGAILTVTSLSLSAVYAATRRWSISRIILVKRQEHRVHWEHVTGALIIVALIIVMALVTLGLALLA